MKVAGKIFQAASGSEPGLNIGERLREIRKIAGVTQSELAERLSIGQTALSKLEKRTDIHVSTLRDYLEALGAKLRVDARFEDPSALVGHLNEAPLGFEYKDENQLVLPIVGEDIFPARRDIVFSIKPEYSEKIVQGIKTVELRRRFPPNVPIGTVALIYATSPMRALTGIAEISGVIRQTPSKIWKDFALDACIDKADFDTYFAGVENGFVIKLRRARALTRNLKLDELRERFNFEPRNHTFMLRVGCGRPFAMSAAKYLIDTNVFIGLEDQHEVTAEFAALLRFTGKHNIGVFVHEAARDDISRDNDTERRRISLSKIDKFQILAKVRGLTKNALAVEFGSLPRPNDLVDATLLHALKIGVADFLITQDRGLHQRARQFAPGLSRRVLYVADAVSLLRSTYEPVDVPLRFVEEVDAHSIPTSDPIFDSLREGYPEFDTWWAEKCVKQLRKCWIVIDDGDLAGLIVRKDENQTNTDAVTYAQKILKICTFKVRPERRGIKLGELLLKQALWFAQSNRYELVYLTTFSEQLTLIDLIEFYGFHKTKTNDDGEMTYEKTLSHLPLVPAAEQTFFDAARLNYPRFCASSNVEAYGVPIKEEYHEILFPELADRMQPDLFELTGGGSGPKTPGNTIRKVYLCRAKAVILQSGALLAFYKGKSKRPPSQAITTIGIFEDMRLAHSTEELRQLAGGRSVYSDRQLSNFGASQHSPVKVINFLLAGHIRPPIVLSELQTKRVVVGHPPQSIYQLSTSRFRPILDRTNFGFEV